MKGLLNLEIESKDEVIRPFDDMADGAVWGEGVAAILLKPLDKALKDNDNIHAVIRGIAATQDGASVSITAPNVLAQEELYIRAWTDAGIDPETVTYIETHGTGTRLGDPIEIDGITRAFNRYTQKKQFCTIGTAKANIGHLNAAAGIVGVIKAALTLKKGEIPPLLHFTKPNHRIDFENSQVSINKELSTFKTNGHPKRCGVNCFGFNGTNGHVVMEEAPPCEEQSNASEDFPQLLAISAKSCEALRELAVKYKKLINSGNEINVKNICFTANTGRNHYAYRLAVIAKDSDDFKRKIVELDIERISGTYIYFNEFESADSIEEAVSNNKAELSEVASMKIKQFNESQEKAPSCYMKSAFYMPEERTLNGTNCIKMKSLKE